MEKRKNYFEKKNKIARKGRGLGGEGRKIINTKLFKKKKNKITNRVTVGLLLQLLLHSNYPND